MSTGTGFFFQFAVDASGQIPVIVTNKHVVANAVSGRFLLHLAADGGPAPGENIEVKLDKFEQRWIPHPDSSVDLCIMPVGTLFNEAQSRQKSVFTVSLDKSLIPTDDELKELTALEDIVMIGYPNGIWDAHNNMPIIRKGITATHPALNYETRKEFMIDAACFPGSSGSPVFLFNAGIYATREGGTVLGTRIKFLGVLYAGPQHTATGEVEIVNVPTQQKVVAFSRIPNNLGLVIRSERLSEFEGLVNQLLANDANA